MSAKKESNRSAIGIVLITIGVFMLLAKIGLISDQIFLYLIGGGFILTYFMLGGNQQYGNIGFLIPGSILIAISLFADLESTPFFNALGGGLFFIFLAAAFLVVWLHTRQFSSEDWGSRNWPIFPAGGLTIFGVFVFLAEHDKFIIGKIKMMNMIIPVILILVGIYIFINSKKTEIEDSNSDHSEIE